jgi:hypothetical protein
MSTRPWPPTLSSRNWWPPKLKKPVRDRLLRGALAVGEGGERHVGLEGRARRVGAGQRAVDHRLVGVLVQFLPVLRVDPVDEEVRVEPGLGHEGEHAAGGRVDRHQRAAPVAEGAIDHFLQPGVDLEHEVAARHRRRRGERAHRPPAGVDLDLREPGGAVQVLLVARLEAGLADVVRALVVGLRAVGLEALDVALADAADVAHDVGKELALRVLAEQPRIDLHTREAVAVRGEARDLLVGEPRADGEAADALRLLEELAEPPPVARRDVHHRGELVDERFEIRHPGWRDLEGVGRVVVREHHAVAVDDDAAVGHDGHHGNPVVLRQRMKMVVPDELQVAEAQEQRAEEHEHEAGKERHAPPEGGELALGIAKFDEAGHEIRSGRGRTAAAAAV